MTSDATSEEFFEAKYRGDADPWRFATDNYEQSRYLATVNALTSRSYQRAFEPGCSIGILTERLAERCAELHSIDISSTAVAIALERCAHLPNVHICHASLPAGIPDGNFDLIAFSEIGYYFDGDELAFLAATLASRLVKGGTFLAVHWLGSSDDHYMGGDEVHRIIAEVPSLKNDLSERHRNFRLDRWSKL